MIRYILDTDHLTLLNRGNLTLVQHLIDAEQRAIAITVITAEEQVQGWLNAVRHASNPARSNRLMWAYLGLRETIQYLNTFTVLDFDEAAYSLYLELRRQGIRIGTQDLRIAVIAIVHGATLLTRNRKDFAQVPNLQLEDWTR